MEGRCLFLRITTYGEGDPTWEHPNPNIERAIYEQNTEACQPPTAELTFDALSYVWGNSRWFHRRTVLVECFEASGASSRLQEGETTWKRLNIGKNLDLALRDVRHHDRHHVMWIDAICINQSDTNERNKQVTRMADIYSQASQVVVWLGSPREKTDGAITALKRIGQSVKMLRKGRVLAPTPESTSGWHRPDLQMPLSEEEWESIHYLVRCQWFERVWVVQEALLGGTKMILQCGQSDISWNVFCRAVEAIQQNHYISDNLRTDIDMVYNICSTSYAHEAAKYILMLGAKRFCSDPRDQVYGFLGLLPVGLRSRIRPDYSAPVQEAYTSCTLAYINHIRRLEILDLCGHGHQPSDGPSWVFDPSCVQRDKGFYLTAGWPVRQWEPDDLYRASYATGESLLEALKRWQGQWSTNALFGEIAREGDFSLSDLTGQEREPLERLVGRRLITCDNSFIGIGPTETEPDMFLVMRRSTDLWILNSAGDFICILLGHENPVVLRKQGDGNYKLVGICYLHGVSDGVALLGPLPTPWRVQRFGDITSITMDCKFYNPDKDILCDEDPRLDPLGDEWERLSNRDRTSGDPQIFKEFRHRPTGRIIKSDPRTYAGSSKKARHTS
ncbi:heterokaryon incompatibility protein-domain-containing protein [Xylariaceae sp. AK1471]|nr:heterokaryon incompatibility protein-domain-containing protein [Xylariaceae sp. AK1471]